MKALMKTLPGPGNVQLVDIPDPQPGPGEVKIEIAYTGVCGTDLHIQADRFINFPPVVLGHEISGRVAALGSGVTKFQPGERVTINPGAGRHCGICRHCREGYYMFCKQRQGVGSRLNGGFARFCLMPEEIVYHLPDKINDQAGALVEPLACAVQAVLELTSVQAGDLVFISGPGLMGLLTTQLVLAEGGLPLVCGLPEDEDRLALAREFGAAYTAIVGKENIYGLVKEISSGYGMDIAFECAGSPDSLEQCLDAVAQRGKLTQIGVMGRPIKLDFDRIFFKQLEVRASFATNWRSWDRALRLITQGKVNLEPLVSATMPIDNWKQAFANLRDRVGIRTLLYPAENTSE
jgi:L-iditol 2-dehydrogenase